MVAPTSNPELLALAVQIVSAHASHNGVSPDALSAVIRSVYDTLTGLAVGNSTLPAAKPAPKVPVNKSVFSDYIVCLEDGKQRKMLKRHLMTAYGMTPEGYRERWGLPPTYPMTAPKYAAQRSAMAKSFGLGIRNAVEPERPAPPIQKVPEGVRGSRKKKAAE